MMKTSDLITRRQFIATASLAAGTLCAAEAAPAGAYQIGCYTRPWSAHDWRVALDAIAEAGFQYAGLMHSNLLSVGSTVEEARSVGQECKKRGLKLASVWASRFGVAESVEAGVADLKRRVDNCLACGATSLLIGGTGNPKLHDIYYKTVAEACDYAAAKGVGLSVKPHGGSNATGAQCRKIIERVGKNSFGLWYDPGNVLFYSQGALDPVADAATVGGLVMGMSIKDYPRGGLLAKPLRHAAPGTGLVNFPAVMANLKRGGFVRGPLMIECLEEGDLPVLAAGAKKARLFLEELTGQRT
jgi:sugar phosphate isomerase/epimerase